MSDTFGRRLSQSEAYALGYRNVSLRRDDKTVQSMETRDGYRVTYGAPSYSSAVVKADRMVMSENGLPPLDKLGPLRDVVALSADPASKRILCLHFNREVGGSDREAILAAINMAPRSTLKQDTPSHD